MTEAELFYQNPSFIIKAKLDFIESQETNQDIAYAQSVQKAQREEFEVVNYSTKKELKQAITDINKKIDDLVVLNRRSVFDYQDKIDLYLQKKKKLLYLQNPPRQYTSGVSNKEQAKAVPVEHFLKFNRAGFANCIFHKEKTGSMHKIPGTNLVWCFSCQRKGDTIDVVMALNGCDFPSAIKLILNK